MALSSKFIEKNYAMQAFLQDIEVFNNIQEVILALTDTILERE